MVATRSCKERNEEGKPCRAPPLHGSDFCVFHDPSFAETLQEARRAGGQRRRREGTLAAGYDVQGLDSMTALYRLLEIITFDALALENSVARGRLMLGVVTAGAKLLEVGDQEERLASVEAALGPRLVKDTRRR
jgi:hypothetical protein